MEEGKRMGLMSENRYSMQPIPCEFANYMPIGGSFHCAALDIRRRGTLQSYF